MGGKGAGFYICRSLEATQVEGGRSQRTHCIPEGQKLQELGKYQQPIVASALTQVSLYIVVDNLNLLKNPCTIAHHISLSKNTFCSLTMAPWGGNEGKEDRRLHKKEKTCGSEFTGIKS